MYNEGWNDVQKRKSVGAIQLINRRCLLIQQNAKRQGDPLSPYLFILAIEPLAAAIKRGQIHGIKVDRTEFLIGQYADDTFLLLDGEEGSLREALNIFRNFHLCSGLRINVEKTCAVWVGRDSLQKQPICEDLGLQWTRSFKLLGIKFDVDNLDRMVQLNLDDKLTEIEKVLCV